MAELTTEIRDAIETWDVDTIEEMFRNLLDRAEAAETERDNLKLELHRALVQQEGG